MVSDNAKYSRPDSTGQESDHENDAPAKAGVKGRARNSSTSNGTASSLSKATTGSRDTSKDVDDGSQGEPASKRDKKSSASGKARSSGRSKDSKKDPKRKGGEKALRKHGLDQIAIAADMLDQEKEAIEAAAALLTGISEELGSQDDDQSTPQQSANPSRVESPESPAPTTPLPPMAAMSYITLPKSSDQLSPLKIPSSYSLLGTNNHFVSGSAFSDTTSDTASQQGVLSEKGDVDETTKRRRRRRRGSKDGDPNWPLSDRERRIRTDEMLWGWRLSHRPFGDLKMWVEDLSPKDKHMFMEARRRLFGRRRRRLCRARHRSRQEGDQDEEDVDEDEDGIDKKAEEEADGNGKASRKDSDASSAVKSSSKGKESRSRRSSTGSKGSSKGGKGHPVHFAKQFAPGAPPTLPQLQLQRLQQLQPFHLQHSLVQLPNFHPQFQPAQGHLGVTPLIPSPSFQQNASKGVIGKAAGQQLLGQQKLGNAATGDVGKNQDQLYIPQPEQHLVFGVHAQQQGQPKQKPQQSAQQAQFVQYLGITTQVS